MTLFIKKILDLDTSIFFAVNHARSPFLDAVMPALSDFRILLLLLIPFIAWRLYSGNATERIFWAVGMVAVALSDVICARILKEMVGRARPYELLDGVNLYKGAKWLVTDPSLRSTVKDTLAWPSCHASNMWTAATFLTLWHGNKGIPIVLLAILVSWSRIYLGVHYPLDVIGGAITGLLLGFSAWKAAGFVISLRSADD